MELVHYGNETIRINGTEYPFQDFKKLEPTYSVMYGFHTRVYRKGTEHFITDGFNSLRLPVNDPYCDRICNREGELARLVMTLNNTRGSSPK